jgi:type II secretory pathway pseudopilin PulG
MPVSIRKAQGFALIDLVFVAGVIGLLCSIALPRLLLAKQAAGAASAIGSMRVINSAQLTYALTCGAGFYAPNLTTLGTPPAGSREAFITASLGQSATVIKATRSRCRRRRTVAHRRHGMAPVPVRRGRASSRPPTLSMA